MAKRKSKRQKKLDRIAAARGRAGSQKKNSFNPFENIYYIRSYLSLISLFVAGAGVLIIVWTTPISPKLGWFFGSLAIVAGVLLLLKSVFEDEETVTRAAHRTGRNEWLIVFIVLSFPVSIIAQKIHMSFLAEKAQAESDGRVLTMIGYFKSVLVNLAKY